MEASNWWPFLEVPNSSELKQKVKKCIIQRKSQEETRTALNRIMFDFFNNDVIDQIKIEWGKADIPKQYKDGLLQALDCYKFKLYISSSATNASLLQAVIVEKCGMKNECRKDNNVKQCVKDLFKRNELDPRYAILFENYIYFQAYKPDDDKEDCFGRHPLCHGMYQNPPTKKKALNGILVMNHFLHLH